MLASCNASAHCKISTWFLEVMGDDALASHLWVQRLMVRCKGPCECSSWLYEAWGDRVRLFQTSKCQLEPCKKHFWFSEKPDLLFRRLWATFWDVGRPQLISEGQPEPLWCPAQSCCDPASGSPWRCDTQFGNHDYRSFSLFSSFFQVITFILAASLTFKTFCTFSAFRYGLQLHRCLSCFCSSLQAFYSAIPALEIVCFCLPMKIFCSFHLRSGPLQGPLQ